MEAFFKIRQIQPQRKGCVLFQRGQGGSGTRAFVWEDKIKDNHCFGKYCLGITKALSSLLIFMSCLNEHYLHLVLKTYLFLSWALNCYLIFFFPLGFKNQLNSRQALLWELKNTGHQLSE